ncbi:LTA synthase family protein [Hymenobacter actinosclerus]|uniref:Phosphoglycerol transferase MdoB n=1 Tax=Hymenobacter actinosclerus TaxID=82805 RepID=A0A1I0BYD1_9BACT|nr:LTA synthase family protein [Hymenobacter actinosclerus]SET12070.1 Phosphoglycerol transferase MdoB [Hymenobacter actinosclerus]
MPTEFLRLLVRRFALLLGAYLLLRAGFLALNYAVFREASAGQLALAFWHGFRFDISALLLLNIPWLLLSLVPSRGHGWQRLVRALYLLLNGFGLLLNLVDWEYFKFIGRRTSNELSTIGADVQRQAGQLLLSYWWLLLPFGVLLAALWYFYPMPRVELQADEKELQAASYKQQTVSSELQAEGLMRKWSAKKLAACSLQLVAIAALTVLGIRGGLQLKPLRTGAAFVQQPAVLGHLALNSTFTFLKSLGYKAPERKDYFTSPQALRAALAARPLPQRATVPLPGRNVVVLILESFGSEYNGVENPGRRSYTPFFDSLAIRGGGLLLPDHYANGRRSIEALPAVLAGLPSLMESSFITSDFQTAELHGLGSLLARHGYQTSLFHGAQNGTMGFNTFGGMSGMQQYFGLAEYPGGASSPDFDGHWGIFDEPYLQYFSRQLSRQRQPFFSTLFTLSAHEPFGLPAQYQGKLPTGKLAIQPTIAYSDLALRRFFAAARRQPWYPNTLFMLLADHTSQSAAPDYQNLLGRYKTPLLLFAPGQQLPTLPQPRISQQADVPATVLDLLGLPADGQLLPFGSSVFDAGTSGRALFLSGGSYWLVHADYVTELTADDQVRLYPYRRHQLPATPLAHPDPAKLHQYGDELKACVQFYLNGLADNTLYK